MFTYKATSKYQKPAMNCFSDIDFMLRNASDNDQ